MLGLETQCSLTVNQQKGFKNVLNFINYLN
jgi:hypothetical protein